MEAVSTEHTRNTHTPSTGGGLNSVTEAETWACGLSLLLIYAPELAVDRLGESGAIFLKRLQDWLPLGVLMPNLNTPHLTARSYYRALTEAPTETARILELGRARRA